MMNFGSRAHLDPEILFFFFSGSRARSRKISLERGGWEEEKQKQKFPRRKQQTEKGPLLTLLVTIILRPLSILNKGDGSSEHLTPIDDRYSHSHNIHQRDSWHCRRQPAAEPSRPSLLHHHMAAVGTSS